METRKIFLAGRFVETDKTLDVINPYDGNVIATTFLANEEQLNTAIKAAKHALQVMASYPSYRRFEILVYISEQIRSRQQEIARTLSAESGKPLKFAMSEVLRASQTFLIAAEESKRIPSEHISLDWVKGSDKREGIIKYFPSGIIGGISPFNFPLNLVAHKIAPAIASGSPIILKPASKTPLTALLLADIISQSGLEEGAVSILPMDRTTGNLLVTNEDIAVLSFTGSPEIGYRIQKDAGKKKVILELGGNAAVIISSSADIKDAVAKCLTGGFAYSGQICIHAQRIFIHSSLYKEFINEFIKGIQSLKYGDPADLSTDISCMIDEVNACRIEEWINEARSSGAVTLTGGKRNGCYYEPTLVEKGNAEMKIWKEEVFGPVVVVDAFDDFNDAISMVNSSRFGLQAGLFTFDEREISQAFNRIEVGGLIINDVPTFRADHMPYGGVKDSGAGREGVKYAIQEYMYPRILVKYSY